MRLIDADELIEVFHNQHNRSRGEKREAYLDCAFLTDVHATEPIEAIPIEWFENSNFTLKLQDTTIPINFIIESLIDIWRKEDETD